MASVTTEERGSVWDMVRRELLRTVTRTPKKVLAKMTGHPWPPRVENHWNLNALDAYNVRRYHDALSPLDIESLVGKDDPVILEIGANNGEDSRKFLDHFAQVKLFCFEPDPRAIAKFKTRISDVRCTLIEKAVAASSGTTSFWQSTGDLEGCDPDWDKSGSIHRPTGHLEMTRDVMFDSVIEVPTVSLDQWAHSAFGDRQH